MTKRTFIIAGLVAVLGSAAAMAQPQGGPAPRGLRGGHMAPFGDLGLRGVDLTDAQREQFKSIIESHQPELQKAGEALRHAHRGLADAVQAQPINEEAIRTASAAVGVAMGNEAVLRAKVRAETLTILTAEQQEQLKTRIRRRQ
jgi:periplasmic protein CpxP/Spy